MAGPALVAVGLGALLLLGWFLYRARLDVARLEAERGALWEQSQYIQTLMASLAHGMMIVGPDGRVREASPGLLRLLGWSNRELQGNPWRSLVYEPDLEWYDALIRTLVSREEGEEQAEFRLLNINGSPRWMAITATNLLNDPYVGGFLLQLADVTEQKEAQAVLQDEELHRTLVEQNGDLLAAVDRQGSLAYVSPACQATLGFSQAEFQRLQPQLIHPEDRSRVAEANRQGLAGQPARLAYRIRKKDGDWAWFETVVNPVRDRQGQPAGLVTSSRDVTEQKHLEQQLLHMAYHDPMTGLYNRAAFEERLTRLLTVNRRQPLAVIYADVDNFKVINGSLGHEAGDRALIELSERLQRFVASGGLLARLSGDLFGILLTGLEDADEAIDWVERLAASMDTPVRMNEHEFQVNFTFGIAAGTGQVSTPKELLRGADVALQYAKRQGKARYVLYHPSMTANALERLELDAELRRAVREKQLQLFYQPIIDLRSRSVVGAEALLRWRHPRRGWVSPAEFIPIAEQSGYIVQLGRWVLEQACQEARTWSQRFPGDHPLTVSVNLSAVQVGDPALVDEVAAVLESTGLEPGQLNLEITETALMQNPDLTRPILHRLRSLGTRLAMDDFGAGHSSLHYLKQFPIDVLKIDRSFVSGLGLNEVDNALVRTVVNLAGALGLEVTAEGVESPEQVAELVGIGCERAQGYYYALPVPAEELGPVMSGLSLRAVKGI